MEALNKNVPRVLIVDDVETNRFILRDIILDMENYPILAENGLQALKIVQHIKPQLIFWILPCRKWMAMRYARN